MNMNEMQEFGALIRRAREQRGLTVVDLGNRIGRAHTAVVRIETGKSTNPPEPEVMRALERELGVSRQRMLEVMGYLDPPSNEDNAITIPATDPRAELDAVPVEVPAQALEAHHAVLVDLADAVPVVAHSAPERLPGLLHQMDARLVVGPDGCEVRFGEMTAAFLG